MCASSIEANPLAWNNERRASAVGLPAGLSAAASPLGLLPGALLPGCDAGGEVLMIPREAREGELGATQLPSCAGDVTKHWRAEASPARAEASPARAEASPEGDGAVGAAPVLSMGRGAGVDKGAPWCREHGVAGFAGWRSEASQALARTLVQGPVATGEVLMRSPLGPARARQGDTGAAQAASTEAKGAGGGGRC